MISDITLEIFGKSGGSHHTNEGFLNFNFGYYVFRVEIELLLLDSMLAVMAYLSLDLIQFSYFKIMISSLPLGRVKFKLVYQFWTKEIVSKFYKYVK